MALTPEERAPLGRPGRDPGLRPRWRPEAEGPAQGQRRLSGEGAWAGQGKAGGSGQSPAGRPGPHPLGPRAASPGEALADQALSLVLGPRRIIPLGRRRCGQTGGTRLAPTCKGTSEQRLKGVTEPARRTCMGGAACSGTPGGGGWGQGGGTGADPRRLWGLPATPPRVGTPSQAREGWGVPRSPGCLPPICQGCSASRCRWTSSHFSWPGLTFN